MKGFISPNEQRKVVLQELLWVVMISTGKSALKLRAFRNPDISGRGLNDHHLDLPTSKNLQQLFN